MISLLGHTWTPSVPADAALAWDILVLQHHNNLRASAAALVVTWAPQPKNQRPPVSYSQHGYNTGAFGGSCVNALIERGVDVDEIAAQGLVALEAIKASVISKEDVEAAEVFSVASEADPSSP